MKMAIQGFLAVTAMAWLGQPAQVDARTSILGNTPSAHERSSERPDHSPDCQSRQVSAGFSSADRALIGGWLHRQPVRQKAVAPMPGQRLDFGGLMEARTLPPALAGVLSGHPETVQDLVVGGRVVRLSRDTREVLDVV